jgi:DNA repair protein RadC
MALQNPEKMEDWELLAVLLGTGSPKKPVDVLSKELLAEFGSLSRLCFVSPSLFQEKFGLGRAKSAVLASIKEVISRIQLQRLFSTPKETLLQEIQKHILFRTRVEVRECFYLVSIGPEGNLKRVELLAKGSLKEVGVHFRDIAKILLDDGASFCIIAHNHPDQLANPSEQDWFLFEELRILLEPLDIELLDQWIFGTDGIFSCKLNQIHKQPL